MSKYDSLKELKQQKARKTHICDHCGKFIQSKEEYFAESLKGKINPIYIKRKLRKFCCACYKEFGIKLLER